MIKIYPQQLVYDNKTVKISSSFDSEKGNSGSLWYQVDESYREFIVTERLDAFVTGLLFLGLKTGEDIHVSGKLSKRLHYSLNKYIIKAICLANEEFHPIKITADFLDDTYLNLNAATGTGMSCGVDSLATFIDHEKTEESYRVDYFTFFNVGSHGDYGGLSAEKVFSERYQRVQSFADQLNVPVIKVDSNISEILKLNFRQTNTLRSISAILNLQKLFKIYFYASAYRMDFFRLSDKTTSSYDQLLLGLISTESTSFFSSAAQYTRIERLQLVSGFKPSYEVLDVCTNPGGAKMRINCSRCDKCIRTMLILDTLNTLKLYNKVFNLEYYYKMKSNFIARLYVKKDKETQDLQVLELLGKEGQINQGIIIKSLKLKTLSKLRGLKKKIL